ncbi:uncharacterized protein [Misgurnus anguillicaudatus]|uniref:uncharacterized protein n=1 Tax=Misgurnus anguillicaudatus TaxID=75329 RepID=UPI003CCF15AD
MEQEAQKEKRARLSTTGDELQSATAEAEPSTSTVKKKDKQSLGSFLKGITVPHASSVQLEDSLEAELNGYLMTPAIDGEEDPLAWWKVHRVNFPRLSKLARKYLCIPATSSPSERLFSTSGNVVTCERSCLKPAKVDMLVFLAKNL